MGIKTRKVFETLRVLLAALHTSSYHFLPLNPAFYLFRQNPEIMP